MSFFLRFLPIKFEILFSNFVNLTEIGMAPLLMLLKKDPFLGTLEMAPQTLPLIIKTLLSPNLIGKDLKKNDIYFSGIDFIDQKLNGDINVTSPTGIKSLYDLTSINLAKVFWKGLEA